MEEKEQQARQKGDLTRANHLHKIIREWKAIQDREQTSLSSL